MKLCETCTYDIPGSFCSNTSEEDMKPIIMHVTYKPEYNINCKVNRCYQVTARALSHEKGQENQV